MTTPRRTVTPDELRTILATHRITRAQLAHALKVNRVTVQYWISGRRRPSAAHRAALDSLRDSGDR
jgi:DNA-binding transcriptional regulator YiaG